MTQVSIIVPVYNAEKAIRKCIESILSQEFMDFELILIDDGSKDSSPQILDEYAAKDERVRVVHQPNGGVSAARNKALDLAQGKYVQFLDSDDWIPAESTKILVRTAEDEQCDLVTAGFYRVSGDFVASRSSVNDDRVLTMQQYAEYMKENPADYYFGVLWNKLYRNDLIQKYSLRMNPSLSFCEDFIFNLDYLVHTDRIRALSVPVYYYVRTEGGLVSQNLNPSRLIEMKLSVFSYYSRFFKNILNEEQYESERISIAKFLIAAAGDDIVIPMIPGTSRLGEETVQVSFRSDSVNPLAVSYLEKKLFERYLTLIGEKYDLSLRDMWVLAAAHFSSSVHSAKDIADFTGYTELGIYTSLHKLIFTQYAQLDYSTAPATVALHPNADKVRKDLCDACVDLSAAITRDFSEEEMKNLEMYMRRIDQNMRTVLNVNHDETES